MRQKVTGKKLMASLRKQARLRTNWYACPPRSSLLKDNGAWCRLEMIFALVHRSSRLSTFVGGIRDH